MSAYLVEQIAPARTSRCAAGPASGASSGDARLERVSVEDLGTGATEDLKASAMFVFIGAAPRTPWLPPQIATDDLGFVLTGPALGQRRYPTSDGERDPFLYETSVPGVFAVGDVRAHSVKRVASAVGEGSVAVQFVHQHLRS